MRRLQLLLSTLGLACLGLSGCTNTPATVGAAPATPQQLEAIRAELATKRPGTLAGPIVAVLPEDSLVAASDVPTDLFFIDDLVSIIDSEQNTLAFGHVRAIRGGQVHVQYKSEPSTRAPMEGDLVVRLPK